MGVAAVFLAFSLINYNQQVLTVGAKTFDSITQTTIQRVENKLSHQWTVLDSFSVFLDHADTIPESEMLYYMTNNRRLWHLKELAIRTETGRHFNSFGNEFFLDEDRLSRNAPAADTWLAHSDSFYLIHPVNTFAHFRGERIQVISASEDISQLLRDCAPTDFSGQLQTYMMTKGGEKLNEDHHISSIIDTNLLAYVENHSPSRYLGSRLSPTTAVNNNEYWVGTIRANGTEFYIGFYPIEGADTVYYMVTAVESFWVNENNTRFGEHVIVLSIILIMMAMSLALLSFLTFHRKNREYVEELLTNSKRDSDDKLEAALELAQQSNAAKTAFLSSMSHDIRTPMNAIINVTEFALKEIDNQDKLKEYLGTIKTSSNHLLNLINDVLDMTHIESGKMVLKHNQFKLSEVVNSVSSIIGAAASKKKINFKSHTITLKHDKLRGDDLRLQQVLINLLNNAVKFTPENGTVVLTIEEIPSVKHNYQGYRFIITDTGCGISAETLDKIFEPFSRIEHKGERIEGNGLGLAITKSIVDAMNGDITVQSTPDVGSIFTVRMFFEIDDSDAKVLTINDIISGTPDNPDDMSLPTDFKGIRVLVAEDIQLNQQILEHLLKNMNIVCDFAANGREAVDAFVKSDPFWYSLVFMDIQMPEMNGFDATKAIRLSNHAQANIIPIVAMTANVFDEDVDKCRAAGMNAHLGKPIDPEALARTIASVL